MLTFLTITFWVLVLLAAPVAFVRLILALRGKCIGETPYCKRCNYNRTGIHPDSPCPECGCGTCDMYGWPNVVQGKRTRTLKRITIRLMLVVTLVGGVWGTNWLYGTFTNLPLTFKNATRNSEYNKVRRLAYWFPELADGEFRFSDDSTSPPLSTALRHDDQVMIDLLLDAGATPDGMPSYPINNPLCDAIQRHNIETCRRLLESGADPNITHNYWYGDSLLIIAIDNNSSIEIVNLLIKHKAYVNARNLGGRAALDFAINIDWRNPSPQSQAVINLLRAHGAMTSDELDAMAESAGQSGGGDGDGE